MADNIGVLGASTATAVATATVYTCPANKSAKFRIFASFQAGAASTLTILVNNIVVTAVPAMTAAHFTFTNGGAGMLRAPAATGPTGATPAETVQPAPPIYYLSAGQTVQYTVGTLALQNANCQVVGVEIDHTA